MGITHLSMARLERTPVGTSMCELGAQNIYTADNYMQVAKDYFTEHGFTHRSFDINPHQGAEFLDLRQPLTITEQFDVVTDFGTSEHCNGDYYRVCKNIHELCKAGGYIIRENPKTGNWPGHGVNYLDCAFYEGLADLCGYEIVELTEEPAMGNVTDGWNICTVLRKTDHPFPSINKFGKLTVHTS